MSTDNMYPSMVAHQQLVRNLKKPGIDIQRALTGQDCDLIHMGMLASTESNELLDAIKKHTIYRRPLDLDNVIEELGDLEFALEGIRQSLNISRTQILKANIDKLNKRYKLGVYSDAQAQERADKA